jgi:hypothetical protein
MEGTNGQYLLQFTDYLDGTREETIEHLRRRHLAYYSPEYSSEPPAQSSCVEIKL